MAVVGGHAARARILHHRRRAEHELHEFAGQHADHRAVHAGPQYRCGRAGYPGGHRQGRQGMLPPNMPRPPSYQKANPAEQPVLLPGAHLRHAAALHGRRIRRDPAGAAHLDGERRFARAGVMARRNTPCACRWIPTSWRRAASASMKCRTPSQRSNVNLPTGKLYGAKQAFTVQSSGQLTQRRRLPAHHRGLSNGAPVRLEQLGNVIDSVENDKTGAWFNGERGIILAVQRQPGTNTVEVVDEHPSAAAGVPQRDPAVGESRRSAFDASESIRRLHPRRGIHPGADRLPGGDGDLPLPAQHLARP